MAALRSRPPAFERSGARGENGQSRGKIFKNKMARNIIKVLDIGSQSAKALAAEVRAGDPSLRILGAAMVLTDGLRRGEVSRRESLVPRIKEAMREAERAAGIPFPEGYLAFGWAAGGKAWKLKS